MNQKIINALFLTLILGITVFVTYLAILANKVFIFQPYAYLVDEISDIRVIEGIYNIKSFKEFVHYFFMQNPEPYHGFISYLIPAIASYIPYQIGGKPYLLFSMRMCSTFFVIASYLIFIFTFFKSYLHRFLFYIILVLLPFTNMFIMWPRCESYQYFFLALFFFHAQKNEWKNSKSFIFLGLSLASRISVAPYVLALLIYFFVTNQKNFIKIKELITKPIVYLGLGFLMGQPHVLYLPKTYKWFEHKYRQMFNDTGMSQDFTFSAWLNKAVPLYTGKQWIFFAILFLLALITILNSSRLKKYFMKLKPQQRHLFKVTTLLGGVGCFCLLIIMYRIRIVSSYWYLQQHYIFILLGILVPYTLIPKRSFYLLSTLLLVSFTAHSIMFEYEKSPYFVHHAWNFERAIRRDKTEENIKKEKNYQDIVHALEEVHQFLKRPIHARILADHWQPDSNEKYIIERQWHPSPFFLFDTIKDFKNDVIVVNSHLYYPPEKILQTNNSGEMPTRERGLELYKKYVCPESLGKSELPDCYRHIKINENYFLFYRRSLGLEKLDQ